VTGSKKRESNDRSDVGIDQAPPETITGVSPKATNAPAAVSISTRTLVSTSVPSPLIDVGKVFVGDVIGVMDGVAGPV